MYSFWALFVLYKVQLNNKYIYMASSASEQDESDPALWLATRAGKMELSCLVGTTRHVPLEKFPGKPYNKSFNDQVCSVEIYILLTKHEGRTGRISAHGLDSMDRAQRGPYKKDQGPIFSQYGPEQAWLIRDLLHDWRKQRHKCGIIRDNTRSDT